MVDGSFTKGAYLVDATLKQVDGLFTTSANLVDANFEACMEIHCVVDGSYKKGASMVDAIFEENTANTTAACDHARQKNKQQSYDDCQPSQPAT